MEHDLGRDRPARGWLRQPAETRIYRRLVAGGARDALMPSVVSIRRRWCVLRAVTAVRAGAAPTFNPGDAPAAVFSQ
jgi:hypothetical protein